MPATTCEICDRPATVWVGSRAFCGSHWATVARELADQGKALCARRAHHQRRRDRRN